MYGFPSMITLTPRRLFLVGVLVTGVASGAAAAGVPPSPDSSVTDLAGVLSPQVKTSLARRLEHYEAAGGHQIVVWIGRSSDGVPIEEFAVKAFEAWKIGRAGLDDGLAVFAMTEDHTLRVEVGYALEAKVTDLAASAVIRTTMIPLIRRGEWDQAVVRGVESLVDTIEERPGALAADDADGGDAPSTGEGLTRVEQIGLAIVAGLFLIFLITHPRRALMLLFLLGRGGGGGGGFRGGGGGGGGGFRGGGGRSGGGGATGRW
jgi:uncharacterized protein